MAMCGNGATIGMEIIPTRHKIILSVFLKALAVFCAAARGAATPAIAVWLTAATTRPTSTRAT